MREGCTRDRTGVLNTIADSHKPHLAARMFVTNSATSQNTSLVPVAKILASLKIIPTLTPPGLCHGQFLPDQGAAARPVNQPRPSSSPHSRTGPAASPDVGGRGCSAVLGLGLTDVLNCERSMYLPNHSTSPDLATVAVFGIGGG